ncbi:MAG: DUF502 domain-containing protein [Bacteroidota bacterium]
MKRFFKRIFNYFLQGIFFTAPISATVLVIYYFISLFNSLIPLPMPLQGLGIIMVLALITFLGFIGSSILLRPLFSFFDSIFEEMPLIKVLYTSVKDLMSAFVGQKKKFNEPVLVKISKENDLEKIGFVTAKDLKMLGIGGNKVAVYLPFSYTFSGSLFIVPVENITPINASSTEVMKFIISGGVTDIKTKEL